MKTTTRPPRRSYRATGDEHSNGQDRTTLIAFYVMMAAMGGALLYLIALLLGL